MTSPSQCTLVYSVSIVAVNGRNLEILMVATYLFEAKLVMESSNNLTFPRARHNARSSNQLKG
jgi:hypothetical protein